MLNNVIGLVEAVRDVVDILIPLAFALALLFFFWGLARFILSSSDEDARAQGKQIMIWGIVALFIMASVWGIVTFMGNALGIEREGAVNVPTVRTR